MGLVELVIDGVSAVCLIGIVYHLGRLAGALEGFGERVKALETWRDGVLKHVGVGE